MVEQSKLNLDNEIVENCKELAKNIVVKVFSEIEDKTTKSVERTIARLFGIDGVNEDDIPYPNLLVDFLERKKLLKDGVANYLGKTMVKTGKEAQEIAEMIDKNEMKQKDIENRGNEKVYDLMMSKGKEVTEKLCKLKNLRAEKRARLGENPPPHAYVLTATGNVYEDRIHAIANANFGGDIIAVIRSTAQSLLDYVPYGATTEGYGGTYATQENFRIMRKALDEWGEENGRYVRLSSFCSGLCMPEIAGMGALEGLDNMANDALYGILYRDINMKRTLIDQKFSRLINGYTGVVINTGEDNYLRTADAILAAPSIVASQLINYFSAKQSGMSDEFIGIGNAYEIKPEQENGFLYEWAQALLTRELFGNCKTKYMPPTKHMNGNIFRTHASDTLFNLVTIATKQDIQTIGVPTEGFYTPIIQDRTLSLENVKFVFNNAKDLYDEISFRKDGIIQTRAKDVLKSAFKLLTKINETGLFKAIEEGNFGDVKRSIKTGKGIEGIITKGENYFNPFYELMIKNTK